MAVRSVIKIPVDSSEFTRFKEAFDKHKKAVEGMPDAWKKIAQEAGSSVGSVNSALSHNFAMQKKSMDLFKDESEKSVSYWEKLGHATKGVAGNIRDATLSLLKWSEVGGIIAGLGTLGGFMGLDRLAADVSNKRRSSMRLGMSVGQQQAFNLNFGQFIDSNGYLGFVSQALRDPTQRWRLAAMGLTEGQISNGTTESVSVSGLQRIKSLVDRTPDALLGNLLRSNQVGNMSIQDLEALRRMSPSDFNRAVAQTATDAQKLNITDQQAKRFQEFSRQIERAGKEIETVFVDKLGPLIPTLTKFSESVVNATANTINLLSGGSSTAKKVGAGVGGVIGLMAGGPIGAIAGAGLGAAAGAYLSVPHDNPLLQKWSDHTFGMPEYVSNNVLNLRPYGSSTGFRRFSTVDEGIRAGAKDLLAKEYTHHLDTLKKIISRFAPPGENDTAAYISDVSRRMGIGANTPLNLSDRSTLARLVSAMSIHEGRHPVTPQVVIKVLNETGSSIQIGSTQTAAAAAH